MQDKNKLIDNAKGELEYVITSLKAEIDRLEDTITRIKNSIGVWYKDSDAETAKASIISAKQAIEDYRELIPSPYFTKIDLDNFPQKELFISKFTFPKENVYSWVAPIAKLRFEDIGKAEYKLLNGQVVTIDVIQKSKLKIREGELQELILNDANGSHQLLTNQKVEHKRFGLTDIIEKMEAYQDELIRIKPEGSVLISGAAGSGKTTLALHKIAYLALSEEHKDMYRANKMIVFVQDKGTKDYFDSLLPSLGIDDVQIKTYSEWALELLGLDINYLESVYSDLARSITLENAKKRVLEKLSITEISSDIFEVLRSSYLREFDYEEFKLFERQVDERVIDRFDLTILMSAFLENNDVKEEEKYSLIAVDEAENYLPMQINMLKFFVKKATKSIIYIGDLKQKTKAFALSRWSEVKEVFRDENTIKLPKSYRNTKQILEYLVKKGFDIAIPEELKTGPEVKEIVLENHDAIVNSVAEYLAGIDEKIVVGIIVDTPELKKFISESIEASNIKILTILEAQGVEFETVVLVMESIKDSDDKWLLGNLELMQEFINIKRNLLYVGITRAMNELKVISYSDTTGSIG